MLNINDDCAGTPPPPSGENWYERHKNDPRIVQYANGSTIHGMPVRAWMSEKFYTIDGKTYDDYEFATHQSTPSKNRRTWILVDGEQAADKIDKLIVAITSLQFTATELLEAIKDYPVEDLTAEMQMLRKAIKIGEDAIKT